MLSSSIKSVGAIDNIMVVYIGGHPDDIDIGMSGTLYKYDYGVHRILWLITTDGAADRNEYTFETDPSRQWILSDGQVGTQCGTSGQGKVWSAPDGTQFIRGFYSRDLGQARRGFYYDTSGIRFRTQRTHVSAWGTAYDAWSRIELVFPNYVTVDSMTYSANGQVWEFPDGSLRCANQAFTNAMAWDIAFLINHYVEYYALRKDLLFINAHAPSSVAYNCDGYETGQSNEHPDHCITGNATENAITILKTQYGFGDVLPSWFTIYQSINPKPGYVRIDIDISQQVTQKRDLNRKLWEVSYLNYQDSQCRGFLFYEFWNGNTTARDCDTGPGDLFVYIPDIVFALEIAAVKQ